MRDDVVGAVLRDYEWLIGHRVREAGSVAAYRRQLRAAGDEKEALVADLRAAVAEATGQAAVAARESARFLGRVLGADLLSNSRAA